MKTNRLLVLALAVLSLAACKKDPTGEPQNTPAAAEDLTFEATLNAVTGGPAAAFAKGDAITLFDSKTGNKFTTEGSGATASFKGKAIKSDSYSAVYPALENTARYGGKATVAIPSVQAPVKDGVPAGGIAVATTTSDKLSFNYVTALLKVTIPADAKIVAVEIEAAGDEALAGEAKLSLDGNAAVEVSSPSSKLVISGDALAGTYYLVAAPATLANGYEITVTDELSRRASVKKEGEVKIEAGKTLELAALTGLEWSEDVENPNPTAVPGHLYKVSFNKADFTLITDGSFEAVNPENITAFTKWQFPQAEQIQIVEGHTGQQAVKLENPTPGVWWDVVLQTPALHSGTTYVYTAYLNRTTPHVYNGVRCHLDGPLEEINGPATYVADAGWTRYEKEFTQGANQQWGDTFVGIWGDAGAYVIVDDVNLVPKDYPYSSIEPAEIKPIETFNNKTFSEITAASKTIVFPAGDGKYVVAFSGLSVGGITYDNGVAIAESASLAEGLSIKSLIKSGIKPVPFLEPEADEIAIVPNSGFEKDGKLYIHYYAKVGQNPENEDDWTVSRAGFVVSSDGGKTWTKGTGEWLPESNFVESSIFEKDGTIYMAGSYRGRDIGNFAGFRFARISASEDFTDPSKWEYLDRIKWVPTEADVPNLSVSMMGSRGEGVLTYNAKWERWILIYRGSLGGLVYRDAAAIDDDWSCEKILVKDPEGARLYAPSVLEVTSEGDIVIAASEL